MNDIREAAHRTIRSVASPLRFFALAVGVLGAIIVVLAWKSSLPPDVTVNIIYVASAMLLILIILVAILIMFFPKKLVFDQEAHLAVLREGLGDSELPMSYEPRDLPKVAAPRTIKSGEDKS